MDYFRALLRSTLPSALLILTACGDDTTIMTTAATEATTSTSATSATSAATSTSDSDATTASTGPGETTSTSSASSTTADTSTTADATTTDATTSGTDTTDSDTATDTTDSGTTGDVEDAEYAAMFFAGGLDRVFIRKAEKNSGRCTELRLVWPGQGGFFMIDTPPEWGIEFASIADGLDGCLTFDPLAQPVVDAAAGVGAVTWPEQQVCPTTLDVEVTLDFIAGDLPWVPMKDTLSATQLPIGGC